MARIFPRACRCRVPCFARMDYLYTKGGRPLARQGKDLFVSSGRHIGRIQDGRLFGPNGCYLATIEGDRVVYRSTDSAVTSGRFARMAGSPFARARRAGSALWGAEPELPD